MKSPPIQYPHDVAHEMTETFIREASVPGAAKVVEQLNWHKIEQKAEWLLFYPEEGMHPFFHMIISTSAVAPVRADPDSPYSALVRALHAQ